MGSKIAIISLEIVAAAGFTLGQVAPVPSPAAPSPPASTVGVESASSAAAPSRLEQLEATYLENLRARHKPIIVQYMTDLRAAQAKAITLAEKAAYAAEMARLAKVVADGGVVVPMAKPTPVVAKSAPTPMVRGMMFSLDPNEAIPAQPANATSVVLGEAGWRLSKLPAGNYEIVAEYTCPALPEGGTLEVEFEGQKTVRQMRSTHATKDADTVRLLRITRLVVKEDQVGQVLTVRATGGTSPWFTVRRILISNADKP